MKTAVVISDSHGNRRIFDKIDAQLKECDIIFHLGDVVEDAYFLQNRYGKKVIYVLGNCDGDTSGDYRLVEIEGVKVFLTHGHTYRVKSTLNELYAETLAKGASVCLFGHTHEKCVEDFGNAKLINPGSVSMSAYPASYCYLVFVNGKCIEKLVDIN